MDLEAPIIFAMEDPTMYVNGIYVIQVAQALSFKDLPWPVKTQTSRSRRMR